MAVVNEVITKFGYQGSVSPLENFNKGLGQSIKALGVSIVAVSAATVAFGMWTRQISEAIGETLHLSQETGVAIEAIQELGFVASVTGSSNQALEKSIASLSSKIGEAGQQGNETFQRLGISVRDANGQIKTADNILSEVGQRFKSLGLSLSEQRTYSEALGIDPSLLKLTKLTRNELGKLREEAQANGVITKKQAEDAEALNDSNSRLKATYQAMSKQLAATLAPTMKNTIDTVREFLLANKELIQDGIKVVIEFIGELAKALVRLAPFLAVAVGVFVALKIATLGWAGALALVFSPVVLIIAAIAGAILIIDDLIVAFQGGDSVIAGIFQDWLGWDIRPALVGIVDAFKNAITVIKKLFTDDFATGLYEIFIQPFTRLFQYIKSQISNVLPDWAIKLIDGEEQERKVSPEAAGLIARNREELWGSAQTSNNVTQDIKIEIKTDNPQVAASMVNDGLQEQLKDAKTQFSRGGQ